MWSLVYMIRYYSVLQNFCKWEEDQEVREVDMERRGRVVKRIKICPVHVSVPHGEYNDYILPICTNENKYWEIPDCILKCSYDFAYILVTMN